MVTCIPQSDLERSSLRSTAAQTTSYATFLGKVPFHIWDTAGFDKTTDGQSIRTDINGWFRQGESLGPDRPENLLPDLPITQVVWCMHASEIGDSVVWQQFREIYEECCYRKTLPLIILNLNQLTPSTQSASDWKTSCENRLRQLNLSAGLPQVLMAIREHSNTSSPEYKEDSLSLRQLIQQYVLDHLRHFLDRPYQVNIFVQWNRRQLTG